MRRSSKAKIGIFYYENGNLRSSCSICSEVDFWQDARFCDETTSTGHTGLYLSYQVVHLLKQPLGEGHRTLYRGQIRGPSPTKGGGYVEVFLEGEDCFSSKTAWINDEVVQSGMKGSHGLVKHAFGEVEAVNSSLVVSAREERQMQTSINDYKSITRSRYLLLKTGGRTVSTDLGLQKDDPDDLGSAKQACRARARQGDRCATVTTHRG